MIRPDEVKTGVVVRFLTPDESPDLVGPVQRVDDGFAWVQGERWPVDVVARWSTLIPRPSVEHMWDGATDRWFSPSEWQPTSDAIRLGHARHG
jgi:hypothetical protein